MAASVRWDATTNKCVTVYCTYVCRLTPAETCKIRELFCDSLHGERHGAVQGDMCTAKQYGLIAIIPSTHHAALALQIVLHTVPCWVSNSLGVSLYVRITTVAHTSIAQVDDVFVQH